MASARSTALAAQVVLRYLAESGFTATLAAFAHEARDAMGEPLAEAAAVRLVEVVEQGGKEVGTATCEELEMRCRLLEARLEECRHQIDVQRNELMEKHHLLRVAESRWSTELAAGAGAAMGAQPSSNAAMVAPAATVRGETATAANVLTSAVPQLRPPPKRDSQGRFVSGNGAASGAAADAAQPPSSPSRKRKKNRPHRVTAGAPTSFSELLQGSHGVDSELAADNPSSQHVETTQSHGAREMHNILGDKQLLSWLGHEIADCINTRMGTDASDAREAETDKDGVENEGERAKKSQTSLSAAVMAGVYGDCETDKAAHNRDKNIGDKAAARSLQLSGTTHERASAGKKPISGVGDELDVLKCVDIESFLQELHSKPVEKDASIEANA